MALELFRPFVISGLLKRELAYNIRGAGRLIDDEAPRKSGRSSKRSSRTNTSSSIARLPCTASASRHSSRSSSKAMPSRFTRLVCTAFNADFDGDQMAVHVPLSASRPRLEAARDHGFRQEHLQAWQRRASSCPSTSSTSSSAVTGSPRSSKARKAKARSSRVPNAAIIAHDFGARRPPRKDKSPAVRTGQIRRIRRASSSRPPSAACSSTASCPKTIRTSTRRSTARKLGAIVDDLIDRYGLDSVPPILDKIKKFGFRYATYSGTTWGIDDVMIPAGKSAVIDRKRKGQSEVDSKQFNEGLLDRRRAHRKNIEIWQQAKSEIEKLIPASARQDGSGL